MTSISILNSSGDKTSDEMFGAVGAFSSQLTATSAITAAHKIERNFFIGQIDK
jgi:hypothetical protein